jgi:hypothetical protein
MRTKKLLVEKSSESDKFDGRKDFMEMGIGKFAPNCSNYGVLGCDTA